MQILDNVNNTVKDDLAATVSKGDKLSIAAACFSIYAYQALKKQLDGIDELRFLDWIVSVLFTERNSKSSSATN